MREIPADEIDYWDRHNDARNDTRYRKVEDCDDITDAQQQALHKLDRSQVRSETLQKVIIGLLTAFIGTVTPLLIAILQKM